MANTIWKAIWITGASSGIGKAMVEQLAATGANIAVSARSADRLANLADKFENVSAYPLDVTDAEAVERCADEIEAALGPIDLAIFNAGVSTTGTTARPQAEVFRTIMEINYFGVTNGLAAVAPKMSTRGRGHIAWTASLAGYNGLPGSAAYNASKAALVSLAEASRLELAGSGIDLTIINPGFVHTAMTDKNKFPMPFLVKPQKAAALIIKGLGKKAYEITFPWQVSLFAKFLRLMPYPIFFWIIRTILMPGRSKK